MGTHQQLWRSAGFIFKLYQLQYRIRRLRSDVRNNRSPLSARTNETRVASLACDYLELAASHLNPPNVQFDKWGGSKITIVPVARLAQKFPDARGSARATCLGAIASNVFLPNRTANEESGPGALET